MSEEVTLHVSIPPLQSALTLSGDGGGRIKLDFDETQAPAALNLMAWRGIMIEIVARPVEE